FCYARDDCLADLNSFPTRRSSDLCVSWEPSRLLGACRTLPRLVRTRKQEREAPTHPAAQKKKRSTPNAFGAQHPTFNEELARDRSEEHTSELQSRFDLVCRLLLEK